MAVQKKKLTRHRVGSRRAHHALKATKTTTCPKCQQPTRPHYACPSCGYYRGRNVLKLQQKVEKKIAKTTKAAAPKAKKEKAADAESKKK